jgi:excisionase family DNA binding protein
MTERLVYSPAEAAAMLGCSRQHVYNLMASGQLPSLKLGRARRIRHEDLVAMVDSLVEQGGVA